MRHGVSKVDEERRSLVVIDELDGLVRVTSGQLAHVREHFDKGIISKQVDTVVVTRWRTEKVSKP